MYCIDSDAEEWTGRLVVKSSASSRGVRAVNRRGRIGPKQSRSNSWVTWDDLAETLAGKWAEQRWGLGMIVMHVTLLL